MHTPFCIIMQTLKVKWQILRSLCPVNFSPKALVLLKKFDSAYKTGKKKLIPEPIETLVGLLNAMELVENFPALETVKILR